MIVIADTGALVGALDRSHARRAAIRSVMEKAGLIVIPPTVLTELDHMLRRAAKQRAAGRRPGEIRRLGAEESRRALSWILAQTARTRMVIPTVDENILRTATAVMTGYGGLALDLADAVNVALAQEYRTDCLLTVDERDFRTVRPLTSHTAFRILPQDM